MNYRSKKETNSENDFPPISLIDVVFILLIFFLLNYVVVTLAGSGISGSEKEEGDKVLKLPAVRIDKPIVEREQIDGVRILIQKNDKNLKELENQRPPG